MAEQGERIQFTLYKKRGVEGDVTLSLERGEGAVAILSGPSSTVIHQERDRVTLPVGGDRKSVDRWATWSPQENAFVTIPAADLLRHAKKGNYGLSVEQEFP